MARPFVDVLNPISDHSINDGRVLWLYGVLDSPYSGNRNYWKDLSPRHITGTLAAGPSWVPAVGNSVGIQTNGTTQFGNFGTNNSVLMPTAPFTVAAWFRTTQSTQRQIYSSYSQNVNPAGFIFGVNSDGSVGAGKLSMFLAPNNGTIGIAGSAGTVHNGLWNHGAGVWDGTNIRIYLNGRQVGSASYSTAPVYAATTYHRVGNHSENGNSVAYWSGRLGDVSLWNRPLSAGQILYLYQTSIADYPNGGPLNYLNTAQVVYPATSPPPPPPSTAGNLLLLGVGW